jgi:signal transduction histidine kinase
MNATMTSGARWSQTQRGGLDTACLDDDFASFEPARGNAAPAWRMPRMTSDVVPLRLASPRREAAVSPVDVPFLAHMSHELKNPLNAVLGFAHLMANDVQDPLTERHQRKLKVIEEAAHHLLDTLNDMLCLAQPDSACAGPVSASVAIGPIVANVLRWMEPAARGAGISIEAAPTAAKVAGSGLHIHQVLINLVSNAVKYSQRGAQVRIEVSADAGEVRLSVRDSGPGMSADKVAQLFQPFNRLGAEHRQVDGTGVGLCIVRQLVERMGGHVEVTSVEGLGSEFTVILPAA